jgi:hypothetical protein
MKHTKKYPAIEAALSKATGDSREDAIVVEMRCINPPIGCGKPVPSPQSFRDPISLREYMISGLCQECQDKIFPPTIGETMNNLHNKYL